MERGDPIETGGSLTPGSLARQTSCLTPVQRTPFGHPLPPAGGPLLFRSASPPVRSEAEVLAVVSGQADLLDPAPPPVVPQQPPPAVEYRERLVHRVGVPLALAR